VHKIRKKLPLDTQFYFCSCTFYYFLNLICTNVCYNIVSYLLKARTVASEKQLLLGNAHTQQHMRCHDTWRVQPLLQSDWVNIYAATSRNNRRGVANGVLCGFAPRLYDSTELVQFREWVQCSWGCSCGVLTRATEAEESPLLRFVTKKRLVKTLQRNSHSLELLPSND
jgi:hypothetical protein